MGRTASGKSEWGVRIARELGGEVVGADSRQVYRGLDIGTAKPSAEMLAAAPHHCIDVAPPGIRYSLAEYLAAARSAVADIRSRGRLPVIVGGSGQYVTALMEGWIVPPVPPNERLRGDLQAFADSYGPEALHRELARHDPPTAARIDPRNARRSIRALEVRYLTGKPMSEWAKAREPLPCFVVAPEVGEAELDERIARRTAGMFEAGLVDEVRGLLAGGVHREAPGFDAIGYREVLAHLHAGLPLEQAIEDVKQATRRFARRQRSWFRADDPRISWSADVPLEAIRAAAFDKMSLAAEDS